MLLTSILFIQSFFLPQLSIKNFPEKVENRPDRVFRVAPVQDSVFKTWLKDTLSRIKGDLILEQKSNSAFLSSYIEIGSDSTSFEIIKNYTVQIKSGRLNKHSDDVKRIIELLMEYDEIPSRKYILIFSTSNYYTPSMSNTLIYDNLFEIKELKVIVEKPFSTRKYTCIRGRINSKTQFIKARNENVVKEYNFIWVGNSLKKNELK